jgi:hypothetical protein
MGSATNLWTWWIHGGVKGNCENYKSAMLTWGFHRYLNSGHTLITTYMEGAHLNSPEKNNSIKFETQLRWALSKTRAPGIHMCLPVRCCPGCMHCHYKGHSAWKKLSTAHFFWFPQLNTHVLRDGGLASLGIMDWKEWLSKKMKMIFTTKKNVHIFHLKQCCRKFNEGLPVGV